MCIRDSLVDASDLSLVGQLLVPDRLDRRDLARLEAGDHRGERRGERIELNLYIVGDDAEDVAAGSDAGAEKPAMGDAAEVDTAARETEEEEADTQ